jgi:prophage antirepressor-like protein
MSNLTTFNFNANDLRVVQLDGEPWFVAKDVCVVLGMTNPSISLKCVDDSERAKFNLGLRGLGNANIISESGLYKLVLRSDKPQAKPFQDWVTKTVLPAIRKDGGYIAGEEHIDDDDLLFAKALQVAQRKIERAQLTDHETLLTRLEWSEKL